MKTIYLRGRKNEWKSFSFKIVQDIINILTVEYGISIGENVQIGNNVNIRNNVKIGNYVVIGNYVTLKANVVIGTNVKIGDNTTIGYNVKIKDSVKIGDNAKIGDNVVFKKSPLCIIGTRDNINYFGNQKICIGCIVLSFHDWLGDKGKSIAIKENYTKSEQKEYRNYIKLVIKTYKIKKLWLPKKAT